MPDSIESDPVLSSEGMPPGLIDLLHKSWKPLPHPPVKKRLRPLPSPLLGENERGGEGVRFLPPPDWGD